MADHLEAPATMKEVKAAVWSCGGDKARGPDGITFNFLKQFWDEVKDDFFLFI